MKITIAKNITITQNIPKDKALNLALALDGVDLYYTLLDGNLKCSTCGWGVELHREGVGGREPHFEHKDDNPKVCSSVVLA